MLFPFYLKGGGYRLSQLSAHIAAHIQIINRPETRDPSRATPDSSTRPAARYIIYVPDSKSHTRH